MNQKLIHKLTKSTNLIRENLTDVERHLNYISTTNPKDYKLTERHEAEDSLEACENELIWALIEIHKETLEMIKNIDPETLREMREL
jgi:hypothetical protein